MAGLVRRRLTSRQARRLTRAVKNRIDFLITIVYGNSCGMLYEELHMIRCASWKPSRQARLCLMAEILEKRHTLAQPHSAFDETVTDRKGSRFHRNALQCIASPFRERKEKKMPRHDALRVRKSLRSLYPPRSAKPAETALPTMTVRTRSANNLGFLTRLWQPGSPAPSLESEPAPPVQREFPEVVRFRIARRRIRGASACAAGFGTSVSDLPR